MVMKELPMAAMAPNQPMSGDEAQMARGIRTCHNKLNGLAQELFSAAAEVNAVVKVLHKRGLITQEEFTAQLEAEGKRLEAVFQERELGVRIDSQAGDKYAVPAETLPEIDCAARYHLCHGACCGLEFPLSTQDIEEGVVRWDLGRPYMIRQGEDGYCAHLDRETRRCTIYEQRPVTCRKYDCRNDKRIWVDFEQRIPNPDLYKNAAPGDRNPYPHWPNKRPEAVDDVEKVVEDAAPKAGAEGTTGEAQAPM